MVINNLENVGIGSSVPTTALDVNGTVKATAFVGDGSGLTGVTASGASANSIGSSEVIDDSLTASDLAVDSVGASELADNSVASSNIIDGSVALADMAGDSVDSSKIVDGSIVSADVATDTLTAANLAADSVGASELADNSVASSNIIDGSVALADMAGDSVDSSKIVDGSVALADLASDSVNSAKIVDGSITASDLADDYVNVSGDTMTGVLGITAGLEASPGLVFSGDTNTGIWSPAPDTFAISTAGNEALTILASGKVGIGATSPGQRLHVMGNAAIGGSDTAFLQFRNLADTDHASIGISSGGLVLSGLSNPTSGEHVMINNSGNVGIGTSTPAYKLEVQDGAVGLAKFEDTNLGHYFEVNSNGVARKFANATAATNQIIFLNTNGTVGSIVSSGTTTSYATTSDERLKEKVGGRFVKGALDKVNDIEVWNYHFIKDKQQALQDGETPTIHTGFMAQQLNSVFPQAVLGSEGDTEFDEQGLPLTPMSVDYSKVVPLLTAAIQDLDQQISSEVNSCHMTKKDMEAIRVQVRKNDRSIASNKKSIDKNKERVEKLEQEVEQLREQNKQLMDALSKIKDLLIEQNH